MMIYDTKDLSNALSQAKNPGVNLLRTGALCLRCGVHKPRKNGRWLRTRDGGRRFVCADCKT